MAGSQFQSVQRGIIFLTGSTLCLIGVLLTVKLIKKRIDLRKKAEREEVEMDSAADKYKESSEQTVHTFEEAVVKDTVLTDDDNCTVRFMKKVVEFHTNFYPLLMGLILAFVMGKSFAFHFTVYIIGIICCMCFNVFKVHRACIDFVLSRWIIEFIFPLCCLLLLVALIAGDSTTMLYHIVEG